MKLKQLLDEFVWCDNKERRAYLKAEIRKIEIEYMMRCYDIAQAAKEREEKSIEVVGLSIPTDRKQKENRAMDSIAI